MGEKGTKKFAFQGSSLRKMLEDGFLHRKGSREPTEGREVLFRVSPGLAMSPVAAPWEQGVD